MRAHCTIIYPFNILLLSLQYQWRNTQPGQPLCLTNRWWEQYNSLETSGGITIFRISLYFRGISIASLALHFVKLLRGMRDMRGIWGFGGWGWVSVWLKLKKFPRQYSRPRLYCLGNWIFGLPFIPGRPWKGENMYNASVRQWNGGLTPILLLLILFKVIYWLLDGCIQVEHENWCMRCKFYEHRKQDLLTDWTRDRTELFNRISVTFREAVQLQVQQSTVSESRQKQLDICNELYSKVHRQS